MMPIVGLSLHRPANRSNGKAKTDKGVMGAEVVRVQKID